MKKKTGGARKARNPNKQTTYPTREKGSLVQARGPSASLTTIREVWMPIFPARTVRRMRYSTSFGLTTTSGVPAAYVLRANDLFDPDFTSTGHQPMGFDQMMLFYNHFVVVKAKVRVVFKNTGTSVPTVCIRQDANSTALTVIDRLVEFGGLVSETLEVKGAYGANKTLELNLDVGKLQGLNRQAIAADPSLRGDAATSPTEVTYFHIMVWDATSTTGSISTDVILEQDAIFMEPRDQIESLRVLSEAKDPQHPHSQPKGEWVFTPVPPK